MAISRFGSDSDVYIYEAWSGGFECCMCRIGGNKAVLLASSGDALDHLLRHREEGHKVPDDAIEELRMEFRKTGGCP